ncbi:MAG: ABC transporter permease [Bdellovibrionales bacterium]
MTGLHRKLFRDFRGMGGQIFTIALLIIGGVSVLVSSWSSYQSLQAAKEMFYKEFRFADIFAEVVRAPESVAQTIAHLDGVAQLETRIIKEGLVEVRGQVEPALGRFISWHGDPQSINLIYLRQGRMPQAASPIEVIVHEAFATAHRLRTGETLRVLIGGKQKDLIVSGVGLSPEYVYALSPIAPLPDDKHFGVFWMRHEDLIALTGMDGAFNSLQIKADHHDSVNELKRQIDVILQPYGNIQAYDRIRQLSNLFVEDEIRQQRVMAIVIPSIFLAVAMFILNIILSRMISLHRAQIATLKSLGYGAWTLLFHYFQLVTLILIAGIVPSLFLGAWIGKWYSGLYEDFFRFPSINFSLSSSAIILGIMAGLVPGWVGAIGALRRVFSLQPAEALRPLSPPSFQKGLFEKFGLGRRLNLFSKMILRSMLFRPLRLSLSVLGIAAALAILINGSFWTDIIDFMINRQFHEMRREDLTVRLGHPRGLSVLSEINRIPGVITAEGERSVPVRVQFKNYKKEASLLGRNKGATLSRVLDEKGRLIEPSPGGVLLSRYFEKTFGLRPGDLVDMKVLEGTQAEFAVPVMGFVDDLVGQQAYALKHDLHRWQKETPTFDTLQVKIDPMYADSIYVALKSRPEVAGITIRRLLLNSFTETVANMITTFTVILYLFAVAIVGAVIYNSARINFSERAWELASLRILGFGVRPSFEILFLDIGLQVLLALIPGLALGYWLSYLSTNLIHNETFKFPLVIELSTYAAAVLVLVFTYLVSGVLLYRKVNQLDFSEALKARE